jgi:hypothetical protein
VTSLSLARLKGLTDWTQAVFYSDVPELDEQSGCEATCQLSLLRPLQWDNHFSGGS